MANQEPATSVGGETQTTEVGSVFVSNYPPYSFWSDDASSTVQKVLASPQSSPPNLGLYLHLPFCRKRCKFCYFRVFTDKNATEIDRYLTALDSEAGLLVEQPAIQDRPLKLVYFGGGTPSFISSKHLRQLTTALRRRFDWSGVEEFAFECEPGTLTQQKLQTIRDVGVTRLSLGVENFDDKILEENGRAHVTKEIFRVEPWIRALDFPQLNIDLIAGMVGETWETWRVSVAKAIELSPDSVTIYQMELPYNTVYSKGILGGGSSPIANWKLKREWHHYAFEELASAGYEVSSAYTMVKQGSATKFLYRDALWHGDDLISLGVSSFGHLSGTHYQNEAAWTPYLDAVEAGQIPISRAYATSAEEQLTREWILQMKMGRLNIDYFRKKFGVDPLERFAKPLGELHQSGLLNYADDELELSREGLLRVDQLLPNFYDARFQNARYT